MKQETLAENKVNTRLLNKKWTRRVSLPNLIRGAIAMHCPLPF